MPESVEPDKPIAGRSEVGATEPEAVPFKGQEIPEQTPSKEFESLMQEPTHMATEKPPTPMELARMQRGGATEVNEESLRNGLEQVHEKIQALKGIVTSEQLAGMSDAQRALLNSKLGQFRDNVKGLSKRLGVNFKLDKPKGGMLADASTFVNWLTQGQNQLESATARLADKSEGQVSVMAMMRTQAQMLAADRAINFATAIVGKTADAISKIFQTQI